MTNLLQSLFSCGDSDSQRSSFLNRTACAEQPVLQDVALVAIQSLHVLLRVAIATRVLQMLPTAWKFCAYLFGLILCRKHNSQAVNKQCQKLQASREHLLLRTQLKATPFLVEKCVDTLCALADDAQAKPKSSEAPNQEHEMKQELAADSLSLANVEFPSPTSEEKAPEEKQDDSLLLSTPKQRQVLQREEISSDPHHRRSVSPDFFENFEPTLSSSQISIDPDYTLAVDSIHIGVSKEPENDEPEEQDDLANLASEDVPCSEFDFESVASIETDYTPIPAEASGKHSETSSTDEGTVSESLEPRFRIAKPQKPSERIIQKAKALYKAALERQRETKQLKFEAYRTFFRAHNRRYDPSKRTGLACIDLHGQKVESALRILELHLINCGIKNVYQTVIITGRGLHSKGGIPRLKPAIIEVLEGRSDLRFHMTNPGRINVIFLQHKPSSDEKEE